MTPQSGKQRPLVPLLLLHLAAAIVCFAFFTIVPIVACLILMVIGNDPGGPMFFPIFVIGIVLCAGAITMFLGGAVLLSDLLWRHCGVPAWVPPLFIFLVVSIFCWLFFGGAHPAVPPIAGGMVTLAFIVHWAAISTVWYLPRLLFRLFRVPYASPRANDQVTQTES